MGLGNKLIQLPVNYQLRKSLWESLLQFIIYFSCNVSPFDFCAYSSIAIASVSVHCLHLVILEFTCSVFA